MVTLSGRIVRLETDGTGSLQGMLSLPTGQPEGLAIYVHGTWGNFYGNELGQALGQTCLDAGWAYLAANFPGHDETAMDETLEDFAPALEEWARHVGVPNRNVMLIGHSLGALKVLDFMRRESQEFSVRGAVLLAPFDCVAFNQRESNLKQNAIERLRRNRDEIVNSRVFPHWLLRQGMLADLIEPSGPWDILPLRSPETRPRPLPSSTCPVWAAIGSEDFAAVPDPPTVTARLRATGLFREVAFVEGAPHNFAGRLTEVQRLLQGWLSSAS